MPEDVVISNVNIEMTKNADTGKADQAVSKRHWRLASKDDLSLCMLKKCCAELLGTFYLILLCVGAANSRVFVYLPTSQHPLYFLPIAMAFGFGIGGIVHLLSNSSGGHVNPAVTLALTLDGRCSLIQCIFYIIFQFLGGFAGAGVLWGIGNHDGLFDQQATSGSNAYATGDINGFQAFFIEVLGTMFLLLTVLSTIEERRGYAPSYSQPLAIGISIMVLHIFMIPYTNCSINPVRGLVWNVVTGNADYQTWIFVVAPLVASVVTVPIYRFVLV